jgi:hypothetical protein
MNINILKFVIAYYTHKLLFPVHCCTYYKMSNVSVML